MKLAVPAERLRSPLARGIGGALLSFVLAATLFARYSPNGTLHRDPSIYAYEGQQFSHGVPVYVSIFDAKGPLAGILAGLAAAAAHVVGVDDLHAIRVAFFLLACLTAVAVYLLTVALWASWGSPVAGLVAATVFCSFQAFAGDALRGPDAKTPGVLLAVLSMVLLTRGRWFWAALAGALSFLVWQPLAGFALVALACAPLRAERGTRRRAFGMAVAGAAAPVLATVVYYWIAGALGRLVESALVFPLAGVKRGQETFRHRLGVIHHVADRSTGFAGWPFWSGLAILLLAVAVHLVLGRADLRRAVRDPLVSVVLPTLLLIGGYSSVDFQGPPDLYPLLPYPALGFGALAASALIRLRTTPQRRVVTAGWLVGAVVFAGFTWQHYTDDPTRNSGLVAQRADGCALRRMLGADGTLVSLGDPTPFVLTGRRSPTRYIYLASGVDLWKLDHTRGGLPAWQAQIASYHPAVIVVNGWYTSVRARMRTWLKATYERAYVGRYRVYLGPGVRARARLSGVRLTRGPTDSVTGPGGRRLPVRCG